MLRLGLAFLCSTLLLALPVRAADLAAQRTALLDADRAFEQATQSHGLEGWVGAFAEDGIMVPPSGPLPAGGAKPIREVMAPAFAQKGYTLHWTPERADVAQSGDLGFTIGTYEQHIPGKDGKVTVLTGRYVTIWRKQADGSWKVLVDVGSENPSRPGAAADNAKPGS
jgi:ketosteroid isomerase-like protein